MMPGWGFGEEPDDELDDTDARYNVADTVSVRAWCKKETAKAILVCLKDQDAREVWVPKSVLDEDSEVYQQDDEGTLIVQDWFASKKGME